MIKELVTVEKDVKGHIYLAGTDGQPIRLPGKEYESLKLENAREATDEEKNYIRENVTRLFLQVTMIATSMTPPRL